MDSADETTKRDVLRQQGVLHPHPEAVTASLFQDSEFFDARDLVQVKYEMLRSVQVEQTPIRQAALQAGLSRPSFYQAQAGFQQGGMAGLIPHKPGPHGAHKLTPPVLAFLQRKRAGQPELAFSQLAQQAHKKFHLRIHPRTIERVLAQRQKKRR